MTSSGESSAEVNQRFGAHQHLRCILGTFQGAELPVQFNDFRRPLEHPRDPKSDVLTQEINQYVEWESLRTGLKTPGAGQSL